MFPYLTGFESTFAPHWPELKCILSQTRHLDKYQDDLLLVKEMGISWMRYPVPWHRIEEDEGKYDWSWFDEVMSIIKDLGLDPILDPLHHTSHPKWLEGGFLNPLFPRIYNDFVRELAQRYPWVTWYTVFNEPLATTLFCGHEGVWYPFAKGPHSFVKMVGNVAKAICQSTATIISINPQAKFLHNDTCESIQAPDGNADSVGYAGFVNARRFLIDDLVLGRVDGRHPMWWYLDEFGMGAAELDWFARHPARIDIRGLDYYPAHEHDFYRHGERCPSDKPRGYANIGLEYSEYLGLPIMLSETNVRGYISDRITWLKYMVLQSEWLAKHPKVDFRGFCYFPVIDSTDWGNGHLKKCTGEIDPVGIYWLDQETMTRHPSELSHYYCQLAKGLIGSKDIRAYRFLPPLDKTMAGYLPQMQFDWVEPTR